MPAPPKNAPGASPPGYRQWAYEQYATAFKSSAAATTPDAHLAAMRRWGRAYTHFLAGWLPQAKHARVLDVGCGDGRFLLFLADRGYRDGLAGVDVAADQIERARALPIRADFREGDLFDALAAAAVTDSNDDEERAGYDLITGLDIIEHLTRDEALAFLAAVHGALNPGGRLILQTLNPASPLSGGIRYGDLTHETAYAPALLADILRANGFSDVVLREAAPPLRGRLRSYLWRYALRPLMKLADRVEVGGSPSPIFTRTYFASAVRREA